MTNSEERIKFIINSIENVNKLLKTLKDDDIFAKELYEITNILVCSDSKYNLYNALIQYTKHQNINSNLLCTAYFIGTLHETISNSDYISTLPTKIYILDKDNNLQPVQIYLSLQDIEDLYFFFLKEYCGKQTSHYTFVKKDKEYIITMSKNVSMLIKLLDSLELNINYYSFNNYLLALRYQLDNIIKKYDISIIFSIFFITGRIISIAKFEKINIELFSEYIDYLLKMFLKSCNS